MAIITVQRTKSVRGHLEQLRVRALALRLNGLLEHWDDVGAADWVAQLIQWEEDERDRRSLVRRLRDAHLGKFKALADFDWTWPKRIERAAIDCDRSAGRRHRHHQRQHPARSRHRDQDRD